MRLANIFKRPLRTWKYLLLVGGFLCIYFLPAPSLAQNITPATGGSNISADDANSTFTSLTDIVIEETSTGQISLGELIFRVPTGFEWNTGVTPTVTIETAAGFKGNKASPLEIEFVEYRNNGRDMVFDVTQTSDQSNNKAGKATFSGLNVRPTSTDIPNKGTISGEGPAASRIGESLGDLEMVPGDPSVLAVNDGSTSTSSWVNSQNITVGNSITVYAILEDSYGNFIENYAANSWELVDVTGGISNSALTVAGDSKSATLSTTNNGSVKIGVTHTDNTIDTVQSGTITYQADDPVKLNIDNQPSTSATAGNQFTTQPVVSVRDQYNNIVKTNDAITVQASRGKGSGTLQGTTSKVVSSGVATFTDLYHKKANTIDIKFSGGGFSSLRSNDITVQPAATDSLEFTTQPQNGEKNAPIPDVEVQLIDPYGNHVSNQNVSVAIEMVSGTGTLSNTSATTNSSGLAPFSSLTFSSTGQKTIRAIDGDNNTAPALSASATSNTFEIFGKGELARFIIEDAGTNSETVSDQTAGSSFDVEFRAVDGQGNLITDYSGSIDLSATVAMENGSGTVNFSGGEAGPHTVRIDSAGDIQLIATDSNNSITSNSNTFTVSPAGISNAVSSITSGKSSITADGQSSTVISLQLKDEHGNNITSQASSADIILESGTGSLGSTGYIGEGLYEATLTSPTNVGSATIGATINGSDVTSGDPTIQFVPGDLSTFEIVDAGGGNTVSDQTAGQSFDVQITAFDANENTVTSFTGTVEITSGATLTEGEGTTNNFTNGVLSSHSITMTSAGNYRIKARRTAFSETGYSDTLYVNPAAAKPTNSILSLNKDFVEVGTTEEATISVQLVDEFGNNLQTSGSGNTVNVSINPDQASPDATLVDDGNGDDQAEAADGDNNGIYTTNIQAGANIETVNITAALNSTNIGDTLELQVTEFNDWTSKSSGNRSSQREWGNTSNWTLGLPTTGQVITVPTNPANGTGYPIINTDQVTIDFLRIQDEATTNLDPGYTMYINEDISGEGVFICDRSTVEIGGDISISTFASSTCNIYLTNGPSNISGDALAGDLYVQSDVTVSADLEINDSLIVESGNTMTVESGASLDVTGEMEINGSLDMEGGSALTITSDTVDGNNYNVEDLNAIFTNDTVAQCVTNFTDFGNLEIDNSNGVTFKSDVVVDDTLKLTDGVMTMASGTNLVANTKTGTLTNLRFLRDIDYSSFGPGWIMLSSPLSTTYNDLFSAITTQGYTGADLTTTNPDSLQPSVLTYKEDFTNCSPNCTDNQRWRTLSDEANSIPTGAGQFVYVFGDITGDARYNNTSPITLDISGAENTGTNGEVDFGVTFTTASDTSDYRRGWNLVGNPYAATIDWDDGNWTKTRVDNAIYIWDPAQGKYLQWNGITGSYDINGGLISPFQAFWIHANGLDPTLKVQQESKTVGGDFKGKRINDHESAPTIELSMTNDSLTASTYFSFTKGGSLQKDRYDAYRLLPFDSEKYASLYSLLGNGNQVVINNLPLKFGRPVKIPIEASFVNKNTTTKEKFSIEWPEIKNVPRGWTIMLEDRQRNSKINMQSQQSYEVELTSQGSGSLKKAKTATDADTVRLSSSNGPQSTLRTVVSKSKNRKARFTLVIDPGDNTDVPQKYKLYDNYPNPFNPKTTIQFDVPIESRVRLEVYDILGRRVATLLNRRFQAGQHETTWDPGGLSSGVYIYQMVAGDQRMTRKMTLIK